MQVAELIIHSALKSVKKESRGLHYTLDYPNLLEKAEITILSPQTLKAERNSNITLREM